jgi:plastocyanin
VFGVPCESGNDDSHLSGPRGVAVDNLGNVFISDAGNGRVVVLPKPGAVPTPTPKAKATPKGGTPTPEPTIFPTPPSTSGPPPAPLAFVEFGNPAACPPQGRCPEADVMIPRDLTIRAGDSVRFNIRAQSHQVAIYAPGTRIEDINPDLLGGIAGTPGERAILTDPDARVAESPALPFQQPAPPEWDWDTRGLSPGAYLVICTFKPHLDVGMAGSVVIQ